MKKDVYAIEKVQNNFTRKLFIRIVGLNYSIIPEATIRNRQLKLFSLESRRKVFDMCMVHKLLNPSSMFGPKNFFKTTNSRTRGTAVKIFLARPKSSLRAKSFTYRAGSAYLQVQKSISAPLTLGKFKRRINKMFLKY